jgi:hypothetical protein
VVIGWRCGVSGIKRRLPLIWALPFISPEKALKKVPAGVARQRQGADFH